VEAAFVLPVLLLLAFAVVGVHRVALGKLGVSAVAAEAAAAGARSDSPAEARARAEARGHDVAAGYGLTNGTFRLTVEVRTGGRDGDVTATATYDLDFAGLPLPADWARLTVASTHAAPFEPFRSRWPSGERAP